MQEAPNTCDLQLELGRDGKKIKDSNLSLNTLSVYFFFFFFFVTRKAAYMCFLTMNSSIATDSVNEV